MKKFGWVSCLSWAHTDVLKPAQTMLLMAISMWVSSSLKITQEIQAVFIFYDENDFDWVQDNQSEASHADSHRPTTHTRSGSRVSGQSSLSKLRRGSSSSLPASLLNLGEVRNSNSSQLNLYPLCAAIIIVLLLGQRNNNAAYQYGSYLWWVGESPGFTADYAG
mgnify:CR=1 FL=1